MRAYDHVIIGGGVSGMTSALLLAMDGARVAIVEAFPMLAPTIGGFKRRGSYFETGLHYLGGLGDGHPMDVYFKHLGVAGHIRKKPLDATAYDRIIFGNSGKSVDLACGFRKQREALAALYPDQAACIERFYAAVKDRVMSTPFLNFEKEFDLDYLLNDTGSWETLDSFLSKCTDSDELKKILTIHCLLYGSGPHEATLSLHAMVSGSYTLSAHTIEGGGKALARAYRTRLKELGVDCFCGSPVQMIRITEDKAIEGVELEDGTMLETPSCVWTGHPAGLMAVTPAHAFRPAFRKRVAALKDTRSAIMLFGIADAPIPALTDRNIFLLPNGSDTTPYDPTSVLSSGAIFLSASQEESGGRMAVTAIAEQDFDSYEQWKDSAIGIRPVEYEALKTRRMADLEREIYQRMPELKGHIDFFEGATPLTIRDYCLTPNGALYGVQQCVDQFNPAPVTKVPGLKLAGQSLIAPGILGAIVSAYITVGIIIGHDKLHTALRQHA